MGPGGTVMKYWAIIEPVDGMFSAYIPDVPYCIAVAETAPLAAERIKDALCAWISAQSGTKVYPPSNTIAAEVWVSESD